MISFTQRSPPPAAASQKGPKSSSHPRDTEEGAQRRPEEARRGPRAPTPGQGEVPRRPRSAGPARLKSGLAAARARAQTQGRARARAHSPGCAAAAPAAPGCGRSEAPRPLRAAASASASALLRAPGPPSAPRAARPDPAPGPGGPRAVTPLFEAARRARLGAKREGFSARSEAELGAAFHQPSSLPGRQEAPPRSPTTCSNSGARGSPASLPRKFPPLSEPRSAGPKSSGLPLRSG